MNTARSTRDGPFCWQSKAARRAIRQAFDATNNVTSALAVYDALTEIASDTGAETFTTTHAWIQRMSGVSVSTIKKHLSVFAELSLITVSTPALRAPSTYVLLSLANGCPTLANDKPALANSSQSGPLATSEERSEENKKNIGGESAPAPLPFPWLSLADLPDELRAFAIDKLGSEAKANEAVAEIVGRKLRFNDTQPTLVAWLAVLRSELAAAAAKRSKGRGFAQQQDYNAWEAVARKFGSDTTQHHEPAPAKASDEPAGWQQFLDEHYSNSQHATGGVLFSSWAEKPADARAQIVRLMSEHGEEAA